MPNSEINDLDELAAVPADADVFAIDDVTVPITTKKLTFARIRTGTYTFTNKTFDLGDNTLTGSTAEFNTALQADTFAYISDNLSVFAATTSLQLLGVISDETGSGALVFGTSPTLTSAVIATGLDMAGTDLDNIQNLIHDISASGTDIDFTEDEVQTISISANTTFTTANRAAGKSKLLKITTDGTLRTLTFPAWDWVTDIPADQAASKNGYLTITSFSTTDAAIVAAYQVGSL